MTKWIGHIVAFVIGCILMLCCVLFQQTEGADTTGWMLILSNAALVPGVLLLGFGILTLIAGEGLFDAAKYTASAIWTHLRGGKLKYESYYLYTKRERKQKTGGVGFMLIPGAIFLIIAFAFTGAFYMI